MINLCTQLEPKFASHPLYISLCLCKALYEIEQCETILIITCCLFVCN